jgi:hypothetical protein
MAAIFQIRRGDSSNTSSLVNGELYLNTNERALQVGTSTAGVPIKMLSLNTASFGDIILTGSAYISGNVVLGGNIYLGNNTGSGTFDSISALGIFTTHLVPNGNIDLGTTIAKWNNAYINNLYAGNGVVSGSSQILGGSGIVSGAAQVTPLLPTGLISGSSQVLGGTNIVSGSQQIIGILSSLNEVSSSLISKTGSYATTGSNSFVGNQSINGNLYLTGSLIPSGNFVYDLGSATNGFGDVYLSSSTVYMNNNAIFGTTDVVPVQVGDYLQGGIVYYVDTVNGFSYIVNKDDIGQVDSSNFTRVAGANSSVLGGGITNTNAITASTGGQQNPAKLCSDFSGSGYTDWYLPSTGELGRIATNTNLMAASLAGVRYVRYWSSTVDSNASKTYYAGDANRNDNIGYYSVPDNNTSVGYVKAVRRTNITEIIRTLSFPNFNFSGSINVAGTIDGIAISAFVTQSNERITNLESSSINLNSFTASNGNTSLNTFSASINGHIADINTKTGSFETKFGNIQASTSSLNSYTSSLKSAIELTGSSVTILGNLVVKGTQLLVDSTTIQLGDNILELNGTAAANGGLLVKDTTGTSGSLLWDSTNDYWKGGTIGNEEKLLRAGSDGVISGSLSSLNTFTASVNGHISDINIKTGSFENKFISIAASTASLNTFSASTNGHIADINTKTGSFETKFTTLGLYTASLDTKNATLQTLTASMQAQIARLQESTASLNLYTSSQDTKNLTLATHTASVLGHITDINTKTGSFENKFTLIQSVTASFNTATASLNTFSASINGHVTDINIWTASVNTKFTTLQSVTASLNSATASLFISASQLTASLTQLRSDFATLQTSVDPNSISGHLIDINAWTASVKGHIVDINTKTGSFETKFSTLGLYTASIDTKFTTLQSLTASNSNRFTRIEESTASLNSYTSSTSNRLSRLEESTASLNTFTSSIATEYEGRATATKTIVSGSSQVSYVGLSNIPSGIISSSAQIDTLFNVDGIVSGSSQINFTQLSGISPNIISSSSDTTNVDMVITGGSISANLCGGVVSGSAQVTSVLTSLNSFTASNANTSLNEFSASENSKSATLANFTSSLATTYEGRANASKTIFSGSSQVNFTQLSEISNGIVSSSAQITPLLPSGVLSGSNQTNITSINQNLGTSTTGVQFASLGIGTAPDATYELKISGDVAATGDIVAYFTSDRRLKNNIQPIENALDKVNELGGYTFDWNEELQKARKGHDIGVVAQEVQSVLPEVVIERDNGYLAIDYERLVPVLIEAIKELSAKIKDLENK